MADQLVNSLVTGSISDSSLTVFGDPLIGTLSQTSFKAVKDYLIAGVSGSGNVNTGSLATTASLNALSSSYSIDSSSFNARIIAVTGSGGTVNTGSLLTTASFNAYTASTAIQIANVFASESNYLPMSSFTPFSASYHVDSASFLAAIQSITGSGGGVSVILFDNYTSSANSQSLNIFASESNYTPTSSFNNLSSSLVAFSASYIPDSASFNSRINTHTNQINNNFSSQSNYLPTSSFVNVGTVSGSGTVNFIPVLNGSTSLSSSRLYQSGSGTGSAILVGGNTTGSNGAILQVFGNTSLGGTIYDGSNSTGSLNQSLVNNGGTILWAPTTSVAPLSSSYVVDSSSFNSRITTDVNNLSSLSGSYVVDSSSFNSKIVVNTNAIANVFASESNFLPTSSVKGTINYQALFTGTGTLSSSMVYQSGSGTGSATLIGGNTTGSNNAMLQVAGGLFVSGAFYDSINSTGSLNSSLISNGGNLLWVATSSGGGGTVNTGSLLTTASFNAYSQSIGTVIYGNPVLGTTVSASIFSSSILNITFNTTSIKDGITIQNLASTGRQGVHVLSSDTSSIGYFGNVGTGASFFAANQVVMGSDTNSDVILYRNLVSYVQLSSSGVVLNQALTVNSVSGGVTKFISAGSTASPGFQIFGDSSNFISIGVNNSGVAINPNTFFLYVNNGYKLYANGTGIGIQFSNPTAQLHLNSGSSAVHTAPLKWTVPVTNSLMTTPEIGSQEYDGLNMYLTNASASTASGIRYAFAKVLFTSASLDFPSTAAGAASDLTIPLLGVADGDPVSLGIPNGSILSDGAYTSWVSASNLVAVRFINNNLVTALDPASGIFRVSVTKLT